ncbi:M48 family metallopeptidase [Psychrobacillus sp. FJAT-21963]|uniref:tetratricopeptide repeat protein n=1 Tax=Psychrobacillus sp. FJAT-21963 TaxID=1712028 RepID=UPI0006F50ED1|nr:tetratricopeptide repeat protein [Psychrobacillus sp. FJAT-21963]KQL36913.1 hypothetical protein AN959_02350 [Psychrobacillus sp. FJAT-21963]
MNQIKFEVKRKNYMNYILCLFVLVIGSTLFYLQNQATKQNEKLLNDTVLYREADLQLQEGDIDSALLTLEELNKRYAADYNVVHRLGYSYMNKQQFSKALIMYTKALDLNPYLVENKNFMYEFATVLTSNKQYDNAIIVIERILTLEIDEAFRNTVTELKDSISSMKGSTS